MQHLTYKLKGNNVPMPSTLVKHLLRHFIPDIIQVSRGHAACLLAMQLGRGAGRGGGLGACSHRWRGKRSVAACHALQKGAQLVVHGRLNKPPPACLPACPRALCTCTHCELLCPLLGTSLPKPLGGLQRRLLPLFPPEFGDYLLASQRGFEATADVAVVGPALKVLDADLAFEVSAWVGS